MNNVDPILARLQQRSVYLSGCRICYGLTPMAPSYKNPLKERVSAELFSRIPRQSGVYFFYNRSGKLLYIGKAKNLRARLSSYRNAKPGAVPEKVIEMIERAHSIRWEVCASEKEALLREGELLHAVRPPFNTAGAWETQYLFIGTRIEKFRKSGISVLHFQLTSREFEEGYKLFGCFKHRPRTKEGYNALLRLIYAASQKKERFHFPARITRSSPAYRYSLKIPDAWSPPLHRFLTGRSNRFLHLLIEKILENDTIPPYMYPSLQHDFEKAREFFLIGPRATCRMKTRHGLGATPLSHRKMDRLIAKELGELVGVP